MMPGAATVERVNADRLEASLPPLITLLQDAVAHGASVGFLNPLGNSTAQAYWQDVVHQVAAGKKIIWLAHRGLDLCGAVQLEPCTRENGRQRAEVQKLFVLHAARQQGIAVALMNALEQYATSRSIRTLHLDTEEGSPAELFYQHLGYDRVGAIPDYAHSSTGSPCATTIYYKQLAQQVLKEAV